MKFFTLFAAGVAAIASPTIEERDIGTVTGAIASISSASAKLQTAVMGFNGAGQVASLQMASQGTIDAINQANSDVAGTSDLTGSEALQLPGPIGDLSTLVQSASNAAIQKKQALVAAGVGSVVYDQLVQIRDASNTFTNTLLGKVPMGLQQIGRNLAAPISNALDKAVAAFADQQGGGSGSATGSATATSSSSGSSSAAPTASAYPTGSSSSSASSAPVVTMSSSSSSSSSSAAATGSASILPVPATPTESATPPQFTGAAAHVAAGFGGVAAAALAVVAAF